MDWLGLILLLVAGLVIGVIAMTWYTVYVLTHPPRRSYAYAVSKGLPSEPKDLRVIDLNGIEHTSIAYQTWEHHGGRVWDLEGLDPTGPAIILVHGWGDSNVVSLTRAPVLLQRASRVVMWELPGHGESPGVCGHAVRETPMLRELIQLIGQPDAAGAGRVVLFGHSLGACICLAATAGQETGAVRGVIAEAPYRAPITPATNALRLAGLPYRVTLPLALGVIGGRLGQRVSWMTRRGVQRTGFDRAVVAKTVSVPVLVIHGDEDTICPIEDGRAIASAAPRGRLEVIQGGGHTTLWTEPATRGLAERAVGGFLAEIRAE